MRDPIRLARSRRRRSTTASPLRRFGAGASAVALCGALVLYAPPAEAGRHRPPQRPRPPATVPSPAPSTTRPTPPTTVPPTTVPPTTTPPTTTPTTVPPTTTPPTTSPQGGTAGTAGTTTPLAAPCTPLRTHACGLPFPSDLWTVADPTSPTGLRLKVQNSVVAQRLIAQIPASVTPESLMDGRSGFSPNGPILFEFDRPIDPNTLPADGGQSVQVFDLGTGERVVVDAGVDTQAARNRVEPATVVRVWPGGRFDWKHHYVAVATDALTAADAPRAYGPSPGMRTALAGPGTPLGDHYAPIVAFLAGKGVPKERIVSAVDFTIRDRGEALAAQQRRLQRAWDDDHPVRNVRAIPGIFPGVGTIVGGEIRLRDFRTGADGAMGDGDGVEYWTDFWLTLPPGGGPFPVVLYGHGITSNKESMFSIVATQNAQHGIATVAIDQPNHGSRIWRDGGSVNDLTKPGEAARLMSIVDQSPIDFVSLRKAVATSLAHLDVAPWNLFGLPDGHPDLDPNHVIYEGTSMGGVLGAAFASAPQSRLDGSVFQVPGAGVIHTLTESVVWRGIGFENVVPADVGGADDALAVAGVQYGLDGGDALSWLDGLIGPDRPSLIVYGGQDAVVPNDSTYALLRAAGIRHVAQAGFTTSVVRIAPLPEVPLSLFGIPVGAALQHSSFSRPEAVAAVGTWLNAWLARFHH